MTEADTVMVIEQPEGQSCAAIGGIMANKMKVNGVLACVVAGRVRDIEELKASGLPVSDDPDLLSSYGRMLVFRGQLYSDVEDRTCRLLARLAR